MKLKKFKYSWNLNVFQLHFKPFKDFFFCILNTFQLNKIFKNFSLDILWLSTKSHYQVVYNSWLYFFVSNIFQIVFSDFNYSFLQTFFYWHVFFNLISCVIYSLHSLYVSLQACLCSIVYIVLINFILRLSERKHAPQDPQDPPYPNPRSSKPLSPPLQAVQIHFMPTCAEMISLQVEALPGNVLRAALRTLAGTQK